MRYFWPEHGNKRHLWTLCSKIEKPFIKPVFWWLVKLAILFWINPVKWYTICYQSILLNEIKNKIYTGVPSLLSQQNLSAMTVRTCSNLTCLSWGGARAPLLPHRNFMWNSVLKVSNINSSVLLKSPKTISAVLLYVGRFSLNFLAAWRCANKVSRPKSWEWFSQLWRQLEDNEELSSFWTPKRTHL